MKKIISLFLLCTVLISSFSFQALASNGTIQTFVEKTATFDDMEELRVTGSSTFVPSEMEANLIYSSDYDVVAVTGTTELSNEKDHTTGNGKSVKLHVNESESNNRIRTKFFNVFKNSAFTSEDIGTKYTVTLWAYSPTDLDITVCTMALAQIQAMQGTSWWNSTPKYKVDVSLLADSWTKITFPFTLSEEDVYYANQTGMLTVQTANGTNERTIYIDDISVVEEVPTSSGAIIDKNEKGLWRKTINFDSWIQENINRDAANKEYAKEVRYLTTTYYANAAKVISSVWQSPLDKYYFKADKSQYTSVASGVDATRVVVESNANIRATTGIGKDLLMYWTDTDGTNYYGDKTASKEQLKLIENVDTAGDKELKLMSGEFNNKINLFNMYSHKDLNSSDIGKIYKLSFDLRNNKANAQCEYTVTIKGFAPFGNMKDSSGNVYNHSLVKGYKEYKGTVAANTKEKVELYIAIDEFMADPDYQLNIIEISTQTYTEVYLDDIVVEDTGIRVSKDFASQFMNGTYQNTSWKASMALPSDISVSFYTGNNTLDKVVGMVSYDGKEIDDILNVNRVTPVNGFATVKKTDNTFNTDSNAVFKFFMWDANTLAPLDKPFIIDMDVINSAVKIKNAKLDNPTITVAEAKAAASIVE